MSYAQVIDLFAKAKLLQLKNPKLPGNFQRISRQSFKDIVAVDR